MSPARGRALTVRGVRLDPASHTVDVGDRRIALSGQEYRLLAELMASAGRIRSAESLLAAVWGPGAGTPDTLKVHIMRLRKKIECDPRRPDYIRTVRGEGYVFDRHSVASPPAVTGGALAPAAAVRSRP